MYNVLQVYRISCLQAFCCIFLYTFYFREGNLTVYIEPDPPSVLQVNCKIY